MERLFLLAKIERGLQQADAGEDVKKIERRLQAEQKKLPHQIEGFEGPKTEV